MSTCKKHKQNPAWGYHDCPGCEVEMLREENQRLRSALERVKSVLMDQEHDNYTKIAKIWQECRNALGEE